MEWARTINGNRTRAVPGAVAYCPSCGMEVSAKCGEINSWHWAHHGGDCDPWSEGETPWHINWKQLFPEDWREVVIPPHRADVKTPNIVIELRLEPAIGNKVNWPADDVTEELANGEQVTNRRSGWRLDEQIYVGISSRIVTSHRTEHSEALITPVFRNPRENRRSSFDHKLRIDRPDVSQRLQLLADRRLTNPEPTGDFALTQPLSDQCPQHERATQPPDVLNMP